MSRISHAPHIQTTLTRGGAGLSTVGLGGGGGAGEGVGVARPDAGGAGGRRPKALPLPLLLPELPDVLLPDAASELSRQSLALAMA